MGQKTFSVLTVSKRTGWEKLALDCLKKQTVWPAPWIIVSDGHAYDDTPTKPWTFTAPKPSKPSNLNASLNAGLRLINTDYVIFYQDFIELQEDCFEKLLNLVDAKTFVTTCTPNYDGSDDGRYTGSDLPRNCRPEEWEANVACAPMAMIRELGGFDERLDYGWSWDNCLLARKAAMIGAKFVLDESNRPKLLPHEMESRKGLTLNDKLCDEIVRKIRDGKEPTSCGHL